MSRRVWVPNPSHPTINCWIADPTWLDCGWIIKRYDKVIPVAGGQEITVVGQKCRLTVSDLERMVRDGSARELIDEPETNQGEP